MQTRCNKCKVGQPAEGDSWCTGCSALELAQSLLGQRWQSPGVRRVAEEALITSARLVRAFSQLDRTLPASAAGSRAESARPSLPTPPPAPPRAERAERDRGRDRSRDRRRRSSKRTADDRSPLRRRGTSQALQPKRRATPHPSQEEDFEFEEESEEEEEAAEDTTVREPPSDIKTERGQERPPEPKEAPRRKRGHKKKKKTRGGKKHQRHYREQANPLKLSHRKLRGADLELSRSPRDALQRRI